MFLHDFYFQAEGGILAYIAGGVTLGLQLICLVHVVRSGRPYYWFWIIFAIPLLGSLAYIFLEMRPGLRLPSFEQIAWRLKSPAQRAAILQENLNESNTIKHRLALASELSAQGNHAAECDVLAQGLKGVFQDDALLLLAHTDALLNAGRPAEAEAALAKVQISSTSHLRPKAALLAARVATDLNQLDKARALFAELVPKYIGEEARYRYAGLLVKCGDKAAAETHYALIMSTYRRGTALWRRSEYPWYAAAGDRLRELSRA